MLRFVSAMTVVAILLVLPAGMSRAAWLAAVAWSLVVLVGRWGGFFSFSGLLRRFTSRNDGERDEPRKDAAGDAPRKDGEGDEHRSLAGCYCGESCCFGWQMGRGFYFCWIASAFHFSQRTVLNSKFFRHNFRYSMIYF